MTTRPYVLGLFSLTLLATACGHKDGPDDIASDTAASSESTAQATGTIDDVIAVAPSSDAAATAMILAAPTVKLWPAGCVTRTVDVAACTPDSCVVHVAFNECTGPRGLVHLSGNEDVTLRRDGGGGLHVDVQGVSLTANGHPFSRTATADVTFGEGGARSAEWHGHTAFVRPDGVTVDHTGSRTIVHEPGTGCRNVRGEGITMRDGREIDATFEDRICRLSTGEDACPTGFETHVHKRSGKTVTLTFDGTAEATLSKGGETSRVALVCTPAP